MLGKAGEKVQTRYLLASELCCISIKSRKRPAILLLIPELSHASNSTGHNGEVRLRLLIHLIPPKEDAINRPIVLQQNNLIVQVSYSELIGGHYSQVNKLVLSNYEVNS